MDILRRSSAQLSDAVWKELDEAAATAAKNVMTARRIATFDGPRGWDYIATPLGTMKACATREGKAVVCVPEIALLAQIRADFSVPWSAVEAFERGGPAMDTSTAEDGRPRGRARGGPPRLLRRARGHGVPRGPRFPAPPARRLVGSGPGDRGSRRRGGDAGPPDGARAVRGGPLAGPVLRVSRRRESRLPGASPHEEHHRRRAPVARDAGRRRALLDARRRLHSHRRRRSRGGLPVARPRRAAPVLRRDHRAADARARSRLRPGRRSRRGPDCAAPRVRDTVSNGRLRWPAASRAPPAPS